jgi:hypothetical protein
MAEEPDGDREAAPSEQAHLLPEQTKKARRPRETESPTWLKASIGLAAIMTVVERTVEVLHHLGLI